MLSHRRNQSRPTINIPILIVGGLFSLLIAASGLVVAQDSATSSTNKTSKHELPEHVIKRFGNPPDVPTGPLSDSVLAALDTAFGDKLKSGAWGPEQSDALKIISASKDARLAWLLSDLMRIASSSDLNAPQLQTQRLHAYRASVGSIV